MFATGKEAEFIKILGKQSSFENSATSKILSIKILEFKRNVCKDRL